MEIEELSDKISKNMSFLKRCECKTLAFLLVHAGEYKTSREIERTTISRQPEVSMALSEFRRRKWIKEKQKHKTGEKGRPIKLIKLSKKPGVILNELINEVQESIDSKIEQLNKLKEICKIFA